MTAYVVESLGRYIPEASKSHCQCPRTLIQVYSSTITNNVHHATRDYFMIESMLYQSSHTVLVLTELELQCVVVVVCLKSPKGFAALVRAFWRVSILL